jgi:hypothetical protein
VVTTKLKGTGQWQAKRAKGAGVIKLNPDDPALSAKNLHDPAAWDIDDDEVGDRDLLPPGEKFHGGTGSADAEAVCGGGQEDGKTFARNLDTGAEVSLSAKKKYRLLVPKAAPTDSDAPGNPTSTSRRTGRSTPRVRRCRTGSAGGALGPGEKFVVANEEGFPIPEFHYEATGDVVQGKGAVVKVLTGPQAGTTAFADVDWSVYPLEPIEDLPGACQRVQPGFLQDGPTLKVDDMPVGSVFVGGKGVPYLLKKKGPKSGAVATNLITGKPYPAIPYSKKFKTLEPKKLGQVPYSKLKQGDAVVVSKLQPGDQFSNGRVDLFEIVAPSPDEELGPKVAYVSYFGKTGRGVSAVAGDAGDVPREVKGAGYDPSKVANPLPTMWTATRRRRQLRTIRCTGCRTRRRAGRSGTGSRCTRCRWVPGSWTPMARRGS